MAHLVHVEYTLLSSIACLQTYIIVCTAVCAYTLMCTCILVALVHVHVTLYACMCVHVHVYGACLLSCTYLVCNWNDLI